MEEPYLQSAYVDSNEPHAFRPLRPGVAVLLQSRAQLSIKSPAKKVRGSPSVKTITTKADRGVIHNIVIYRKCRREYSFFIELLNNRAEPARIHWTIANVFERTLVYTSRQLSFLLSIHRSRKINLSFPFNNYLMNSIRYALLCDARRSTDAAYIKLNNELAIHTRYNGEI